MNSAAAPPRRAAQAAGLVEWRTRPAPPRPAAQGSPGQPRQLGSQRARQPGSPGCGLNSTAAPPQFVYLPICLSVCLSIHLLVCFSESVLACWPARTGERDAVACQARILGRAPHAGGRDWDHLQPARGSSNSGSRRSSGGSSSGGGSCSGGSSGSSGGGGSRARGVLAGVLRCCLCYYLCYCARCVSDLRAVLTRSC